MNHVAAALSACALVVACGADSKGTEDPAEQPQEEDIAQF